jgi:hypothetical protein
MTSSAAGQTVAGALAEPQVSAMLRLVLTGSVDDGKSTLIGRLLYDSKQILTDQLEALRAASARRNGENGLDLSLLTDGLPSASRASRSTSPTATSRPPAASSSSPTPPATSAIRATWSPARRPRIWR